MTTLRERLRSVISSPSARDIFIIGGLAASSVAVTSFLLGLSTSSPNRAQGVPSSYNTDTYVPGEGKGGRTEPPTPPEEPVTVSEPCVPFFIIPSQDTQQVSQGTSLPACPDASTVLNIQTQVNVRLGKISQGPEAQ